MTFRILLVEDEPDVLDAVQRELESEEPEACSVAPYTSFSEAAAMLQECAFDAVVIDLLEGKPEDGAKDTGNSMVRQIREKRFIPIVFFTGFPDRVDLPDQNFLRVIAKTSTPEELKRELLELLKSELVTVARLINSEVGELMRKHYWETLAKVDLPEGQNLHEAVYSSIRHVALELSGERAAALTAKAFEEELEDGKVYPWQQVVWPPVAPAGKARNWTGDIVRVTDGDSAGCFAIVLTPACDLVTGKVPNVLLISALSLTEAAEARGGQQDKIKRNNIDQYHFFPASYELPDLCLDFSMIFHMPVKEAAELKRMATLDDPWVHDVRARFQHYVGRVGTPELTG